MALSTLLLASLASTATAVRLFTSSWPTDGKGNIVRAITFEPGLGYAYGRPSASLTTVSENSECGSTPTWLELDGSTLYCLNEGWAGAAPDDSFNTLTVSADGSLKLKASTKLPLPGAVANQFYNNKQAVALAHYGGGGISTLKALPDGSFSELQTFKFNASGPRPEQEASHVHEAVIDPTGKFLIFPDLGADVVRVYSIDENEITEKKSLQSKAASGPRHAVFWTPNAKPNVDATFLFVIHELDNTVVSYKVAYTDDSALAFTQVQSQGLYGDRETPEGSRAAELLLSPDNRFVIGSNRNATIMTVPNPDPKNATLIPSDTLVTFEPQKDGTLKFVGLAASGGSFPRHFNLNKEGNFVAVGNQNSGTLDIFKRDVKSGKICERVASLGGLGQLTNVRWA
ncbi:putative isomerase YbhE [Lojkania enalia]|uniref:Isomerase YbhE n=1 Tax=Lojkania enalia TaxID=147567 RepID=A0A9P4JVR1_9PLEO|nr:putative isomerase YbhE [Didymosphaeria enalia]